MIQAVPWSRAEIWCKEAVISYTTTLASATVLKSRMEFRKTAILLATQMKLAIIEIKSHKAIIIGPG